MNVHGYENELYPLRASKYRNRKHKIDLLLISLDAGAECATNEANSHYCLIKNFSRLASSQTSAHQHKTFYCRNCLQGYNSEEALSKHSTYCNDHSCVRIELPEKNSTMRFTHIERSMRVPFVAYADFESFIKPINTCDPDEKQSFTKQYQNTLRARSVITSNTLTIQYIKESLSLILHQAKQIPSLVNL